MTHWKEEIIESQINRSLTQKAEKKKEIEMKENSKVTRWRERRNP